MPVGIEERNVAGFSNGAVFEPRTLAGYQVGLASQVMVLEDIAGLFDFPAMGQVEALAFAGMEGLGDVSPQEAITDLGATVTRRRESLEKASAERVRLAKIVEDLDHEIIDVLQPQYNAAVAAGNKDEIERLELVISNKHYERIQAAKNIVRWAKLHVVTLQMLNHAEAQIGIATLYNQAKQEGDAEGMEEFGRQYLELGKSTNEMKRLRARQQRVWKVRSQTDLLEAKQASVDALRSAAAKAPGDQSLTSRLLQKEGEVEQVKRGLDHAKADAVANAPSEVSDANQPESMMEALDGFGAGHATPGYDPSSQSDMVVMDESGTPMVWPSVNTYDGFIGNVGIGSVAVDERQIAHQVEPGEPGLSYYDDPWIGRSGEYEYDLDPGVSGLGGFWGKIGGFFKSVANTMTYGVTGLAEKGIKAIQHKIKSEKTKSAEAKAWEAEHGKGTPPKGPIAKVVDAGKKLTGATGCKIIKTPKANRLYAKYSTKGRTAEVAVKTTQAAACRSAQAFEGKRFPIPGARGRVLAPGRSRIGFRGLLLLTGAVVGGYYLIKSGKGGGVRGIEDFPLAESYGSPGCGCGG